MIPSLDRALHWGIISLTTPLPYGSRVRLRQRGLAALQRRILRHADIFLIRHPKTGGTWLRALLTHLYAAKYGTSPQRVFKGDELHQQDRRLPRYMVTNGYMSWEHVVADAFRRNDPALADKKILFLARHPGDVAVSWHNQYRKRTRAFKRELLEADMPERIDWQRMERWEFVRRPELGLPALIAYQNFWAEQLADRPNALIVRYEDLRADAAVTLTAIVDFLGEAFTPEQIAGAVAFGSVDNLRQLEHSGYFQSGSGLRLRDASDPDTFKVRRAKVGGFRDDLDAEQAAWVEQMVRAQCHPALGYGDATVAAPASVTGHS